MATTDPESPKTSKPSIGTAEALYILFRSLPKKEKLAAAQYILEDEEVRKNEEYFSIPNKVTFNSFEEEISEISEFHSMEGVRNDLVPKPKGSEGRDEHSIGFA